MTRIYPANNSMADQREFFEGLSYRVVGSGPPMIALHGLCETQLTWSHITRLLSPQFQFYLFDLKGHGDSDSPQDGRYSLDDQASIICRFIDDKRLTNVTILGHSLGGGIGLFIALKFSKKKPQPLAKLILIDSIGAPQPIPLFVRLIGLKWLLSFAAKIFPAKSLVRHFLLKNAYSHSSKLSEKFISEYAKNLSNPNGPYVLSTTVKQLLATNPLHWLGEFAAINVPTLILFGKGDRIVRPYVGIQLNVAITKSELDWLPCGHMPQEEVPELVAEHIVRFTKEQPQLARDDV